MRASDIWNLTQQRSPSRIQEYDRESLSKVKYREACDLENVRFKKDVFFVKTIKITHRGYDSS